MTLGTRPARDWTHTMSPDEEAAWVARMCYGAVGVELEQPRAAKRERVTRKPAAPNPFLSPPVETPPLDLDSPTLIAEGLERIKRRTEQLLAGL
jgi:hypothetical protein